MTNSSVPSWTYLHDLPFHEDAYIDTIRRVLASGRLLLGPELRSFESDFATYIGTAYGIGCDNATNGLFLALKSLDIGNGDAVLTVPNTAIPTVSAICQSGATPVFCDVDEHGLIDLKSFDIDSHPNLKAIVPVHLFGYPCNMVQINDFAIQNSLFVIEDCSQAHGTQLDRQLVGTFGHLSVFSFYPTKPLGGIGDAGIILTDNEHLANRLFKLRFYGISDDYYATESGYNSRMDEIHAGILRYKLTKLDSILSKRKQIADYYIQHIDHPCIQFLPPPPNASPSHYLVPFKFSGDRDNFQRYLSEAGIGTNVSYRHPIHTMEAYKYLGYKAGDFPRAEALCDSVISFPIFDSMPQHYLPRIVSVINSHA